MLVPPVRSTWHTAPAPWHLAPCHLAPGTWHHAPDAKGFTRVTWEIEKVSANFSRLTVVHELEGAPIMAQMVANKFSEMGGGWAWILSDLKSLLETGSSM